jgi:hypothetical protein
MEKTAVASITVKIEGGAEKSFTASGTTDGDVHGLAGRLARAVAADAVEWAIDQSLEFRRLEAVG